PRLVSSVACRPPSATQESPKHANEDLLIGLQDERAPGLLAICDDDLRWYRERRPSVRASQPENRCAQPPMSVGSPLLLVVGLLDGPHAQGPELGSHARGFGFVALEPMWAGAQEL